MPQNMAEGRVESSPVKPTMNYEQAKSLFEQESVFFGETNGVPVNRAIELLGTKAVNYSSDSGAEGAGLYFNEFWIKGFRCKYLTRKGFYRAVGYANVMRIAQAEGTRNGQAD